MMVMHERLRVLGERAAGVTPHAGCGRGLNRFGRNAFQTSCEIPSIVSAP